MPPLESSLRGNRPIFRDMPVDGSLGYWGSLQIRTWSYTLGTSMQCWRVTCNTLLVCISKRRATRSREILWEWVCTGTAAKRCGQISTFWDRHNSPEQGPEYSALTLKWTLLWPESWTKIISRGSFQPNFFQWFYFWVVLINKAQEYFRNGKLNHFFHSPNMVHSPFCGTESINLTK